jgi:ABC-2 type transport system ATP-binding protein
MSAQAPSPYAIELVGVSKRFGDTVAVQDLTLRIKPGQSFGFIGPNGAGKTTTIKMLMGMLSMSAGRAYVLGIDVAADPVAVKQRVGYVPELHFIYRGMRVRDVVGLCRALYASWNDQLCTELAKCFDLPMDRRVKHLSKGMLAKLSLLVALGHEPEVLLLDEAMAGLDPLAREEFLDGVLGSLCDRPRTVLFSSHTLGDVQRVADTIGIIDQGRLLAVCPTDELLTGTRRVRVVLADGCTPGEPPEGTIWHRFQGREWLLTVRPFSSATLDYLRQRYRVESLEVVGLGLEDVFKDYIRGQRCPA